VYYDSIAVCAIVFNLKYFLSKSLNLDIDRNMTNLLTEAFKKAQDLPAHLQDELAQQLIKDLKMN
jgi:hypothetical protein